MSELAALLLIGFGVVLGYIAGRDDRKATHRPRTFNNPHLIRQGRRERRVQ